MDDWWAKRRNVLNLIVYMREKSNTTLQRLYTQLSFLDQLCSGNAKALEQVWSVQCRHHYRIVSTRH